MIFDTIKHGIFTADDFFTAHNTSDYSKFTALPIDLRKKFISDVIDKVPNQESNNFKEVAFDFLDGKITEKQFCDAWLKYWLSAAVTPAWSVAVAVVAASAELTMPIPEPSAEYYGPYLEDIAKHLNKLIQEYENDKIN